MHDIRLKLFSGTSNRLLAEEIATIITNPLERVDLSRFNDGEIHVEIKDNVRGCKAVVIQSTCSPTNDMIMELLLIVDALKRSSVSKVIVVIPYFGYARADRRPGYARVPISARVVADMLEAVNIDHIITLDLHVAQIQGLFKIPVDNLSPARLFVNDIIEQHQSEDVMVVSPDVGGVARARTIAKMLNNTDLAIIDKRRPKANVSEVMNIIGDVEDRVCIIYDDIVDTAGTLCKAADALIDKGGASKVIAYCTHGVLSGAAYNNIENSKITELVVTNTIPLKEPHSKIRQLSVADILAETIKRIDLGGSVSELLN